MSEDGTREGEETHLVVRKTGSREDGNLLTTRDRVHRVNGRDTRLDHLLGVDTRIRVDRRTVDVEVLLSEDLGSFVDRVTGSVEDATEHVFRNGELHRRAGELDVRRVDVDAGGTLEDLDDGLATGNLEDLSTANGTVREGEGDNLEVGRCEIGRKG